MVRDQKVTFIFIASVSGSIALYKQGLIFIERIGAMIKSHWVVKGNAAKT